MQFITPIILLGLSIAFFFVFSNPLYVSMTELRTKRASYDAALANSHELEKQREKLTTKYNSIDRTDLIKIQKFLPENIDNIRLILEIEQIALKYHMVLKDIKYNSTADKKNSTPTNGGEGVVIQRVENTQASPKDYGVWDLEFSTSGTYDDFLRFTRALEGNLRIVDVSSIQFSSENQITTPAAGGKVVATSPMLESYKYDFKIKTYWLKN